MIKKPSGQIAILFTLIIVIILLFIAVTLNIGQIAQKKTKLSNIADASALYMASQLGTIATQVSKDNLDGGSRKCKTVDWTMTIIGVIAIAACVVVSVVTFGTATPVTVPLAVGIAALAFGGTALIGVDSMNHQAINAEIDSLLKDLPESLQIQEKGIKYVLDNTVDDPNLEADIYDMDKDNDKAEMVMHYYNWYYERALAMKNDTSPLNGYLEQFKTDLAAFRTKAENFKNYITSTDFQNLLTDIEAIGINGTTYDLSFWDAANTSATTISQLTKISADGEADGEIINFMTRADAINSMPLDGLRASKESLMEEFSSKGGGAQCYVRAQGWKDGSEGSVIGINTWIAELQAYIDQCSCGGTDSPAQDLKTITPSNPNPIVVPGADSVVGTSASGTRPSSCCAVASRIPAVKDTLTAFATDIGNFLIQMDAFVANMQSIKDIETGKYNIATYYWQDSRGAHLMRVEISPFPIPELHQFDDGNDKCVGFKTGGTGDVTVTVTRYDQDQALILPFGRNLWTTRSRNNPQEADVGDANVNRDAALGMGISSQATAHWDYSGNVHL